MEMKLEKTLSYDDILLRPKRSRITSRSEPDVSTKLVGDIEIDIPIVSAAMDTVTDGNMAQALSDAGGVGVVHRHHGNQEEHTSEERIEMQARDISEVDGVVGAAVGIGSDWRERTERAIEAGADFICVDVAHGHLQMSLDVVSQLSDEFDIPLMAGNVSTSEGAIDLVDRGADAIKVGIGPGSHCLTREVAGVGVPQVTAIDEVTDALDKSRALGKIESYVPVVADGGIQSSGDIAKALVLGADTVMIGGMFGGCKESPAETIVTQDGRKYKQTRGMSSDEARDDHGLENNVVAEGDSGLTPYKGSAESVATKLASGTRVSFSYIGAYDISEAREKGEFIQVSPSVQARNGTHGVFTDSKE
jgi:IMP dehydrogenase